MRYMWMLLCWPVVHGTVQGMDVLVRVIGQNRAVQSSFSAAASEPLLANQLPSVKPEASTDHACPISSQPGSEAIEQLGSNVPYQEMPEPNEEYAAYLRRLHRLTYELNLSDRAIEKLVSKLKASPHLRPNDNVELRGQIRKNLNRYHSSGYEFIRSIFGGCLPIQSMVGVFVISPQSADSDDDE